MRLCEGNSVLCFVPRHLLAPLNKGAAQYDTWARTMTKEMFQYLSQNAQSEQGTFVIKGTSVQEVKRERVLQVIA
jgi:hypothetical protein